MVIPKSLSKCHSGLSPLFPPKTVTLTNTGGGTLTFSSLAAGGSNPGDFARSGTCAVNIALTASQSCTVVHTFTPSAATSRWATLAMGTSSGNAAVSLSGRGARK